MAKKLGVMFLEILGEVGILAVIIGLFAVITSDHGFPRELWAGIRQEPGSCLQVLGVAIVFAGVIDVLARTTVLKRVNRVARMICVVFVLLVALVILNLGPHNTRSADSCINHLRLIDSAKQQWALEQRQTNGAIPQPSDIQLYLGRGTNGELPTCPQETNKNPTFSTSYSISPVGVNPTCKILPSLHVLP